MKTFAGSRSLDDLKPLCAARDIVLETERYDNGGSDYVVLDGAIGVVRMTVFYSPWNGVFFGETDRGLKFNNQSPLDGAAWLDELLDLLYVPKVEPAEAADA